MTRWLAMLPPLRWWRSLRALAGRARVHPQAVLLGRVTQVTLGRGCKLGARVRVDPGAQGHVTLGARVWIAADVELQTDTRVQIGADTSVQRRCTINGSTRVGRGCILAPGVFISSGTHPFRAIAHLPIREQERRLAQDEEALGKLDRPIWVQDDCWLGVNAVVCPGVTIGKGSVVGANAVVTHDVPPYSVVAGSPARLIGSRLDWQPPAHLNPAREEDLPYFLDAHLARDASGSHVELTRDTPLLVAMAAEPGLLGLEITCRTTEPASLMANGLPLQLGKGQGTLRLDRRHLQISGEVFHCSLELIEPVHKGSRVEVQGLMCLGASPAE